MSQEVQRYEAEADHGLRLPVTFPRKGNPHMVHYRRDCPFHGDSQHIKDAADPHGKWRHLRESVANMLMRPAHLKARRMVD